MTWCFTSTHHSAFTRSPLTSLGVSIAEAGPADVNAADCAVIRTKNNDYRAYVLLKTSIGNNNIIV